MNIFALIDMDAFFASVEESINPNLRFKPVVIGKRVVACANYEARKFGISSAMPTFEAIKRCPKLLILSGNYKIYSEYSKKLKKLLHTFSPYVYQASIDEFYIRLDTVAANFEEAEIIAFEISKKIKKLFKITASIGIAPTLLTAKIASEVNKPNGIKIIKPEEIKGFLSKTEVKKFPGIGKATLLKLKDLKIYYPNDMEKIPLYRINKFFTKEQVNYLKLLFSGDDKAFFFLKERKNSSISRSVTFELPTTDRKYLLKVIVELLEDIIRNIRLKDYYGDALELSLRSINYKWKSKRKKLQYPSRSQSLLYNTSVDLLKKFSQKESFRGVRIKIDGLTKNHILPLFGEDKIDYIFQQFASLESKYQKPLLKTALFYYYDRLFREKT